MDFCKNSIFSKMDKEEEKKNQGEETPQKSNRDLFMERHRQDFPDDDPNDEEALYGRLNERTAEYDRLRGEDEKMRNFVHDHPQFGSMFLDAMDGRNFIESFLSRFSKEDVLAAFDDPEMADKLADAQAEWLKNQEDSKKLKEEGEANIQNSIKVLSAYCDKNGLDEDTATALWGKGLDYAGDMLKGIFTEEFFDLIYKGMNHDEDVNQARQEGEVAGHNAKIKTQLAKGKTPEGIPPTFDGGQGAAAPEPKPKERKQFYNPFSHRMEYEDEN